MPNADPAVQRLLLDLAEVDQSLDSAAATRSGLPELATIESAAGSRESLENKLLLAKTEVADLDRAGRKLDDEIDSVRRRADHDAELAASGAAPAKELENLQKEMESLARRQNSLEDDALELMEQRENAAGTVEALETELAQVMGNLAEATSSRDRQWTEIDAQVAELRDQRGTLVGGLPAAVLAIYDRLRAAGKVAAAALQGDRCGACRMALDRASLDEIHSAPADSVQRCPECSAILVR